MAASTSQEIVKLWRECLEWPAMSSFCDLLMEAMSEPAPHVVRYLADGGMHYTSPKEFYIGRSARGPSDCVWIIPGTCK